MITVDLVVPAKEGARWSYAPLPRAHAEAAVALRVRMNEVWTLTPHPSCPCCGAPAWDNGRCTKHQDRNPCAAEGCGKTAPANGRLSNTATLCGVHWRLYCPPGGPMRRSFNRLAAKARKMGYKRTDHWPGPLEARWWQLWRGLMRRINRPPEGHLDKAEIDKLFGWDR